MDSSTVSSRFTHAHQIMASEVNTDPVTNMAMGDQLNIRSSIDSIIMLAYLVFIIIGSLNIPTHSLVPVRLIPHLLQGIGNAGEHPRSIRE